jgi:hypothetical protein
METSLKVYATFKARMKKIEKRDGLKLGAARGRQPPVATPCRRRRVE